MSDDLIVEEIGHSDLTSYWRCKVCGYRWSSLADVPRRDLTICPDVFFSDHTGGEEGPEIEETEPEEEEIVESPKTVSEEVTFEVVTVRQELTADDLKLLLETSDLIGDEIVAVAADPEPPNGTDSVLAFQLTMKVPVYHCIVCHEVVERGVNTCSAHRGVLQVLKKEPL